MAIQLLSEQVANQIAAGEVVEGPSSVVKELVENSIDAGASRVSVEISNQLRNIRVADDGAGMSGADLSLAFKRHATSKICNIDDLYRLVTNGFRGEALASIASVSKVTCITKRADDKQATKLYLESGIEELGSAGASTGTSIEVAELFFNTPVRMKFLKSSKREHNEIVDIMRAFALARPETAFTLKIDNKLQLETKPYLRLQPRVQNTSDSETGKQTLIDIFGNPLDSKLVPLSLERGDIHISGYVTSSDYSRSDRRGIYTLLNNRVIRCPVLRSAIDAVYKQYLAAGKYPVVLLRVDIPAADVDVNVHPNKREVKYKNSNTIYTAVGDAIAKALAQAVYASVGIKQISLGQHELAEQQQLNRHERNSTGHCEDSKNEPDGSFLRLQPRVQDLSYVNPTPALDFDTYTEPRTTSTHSRKFISRLGAIDISEIADDQRKTNISSQGNKTSFEIVTSDGLRAVICRGDFVGDNWLKDKYLEFVQGLAIEILEREPKTTSTQAIRSRPSRNPSRSILKQLWARDNYTCVYCAKILLDPDTASAAKSKSHDRKAFRSYLNNRGEMVTINIFDEHAATYDHVLPASKYAELNLELDNLVTSCPACNKQKSDSLATNTWTSVARRSNAWAEVTTENPLRIVDQKFIKPD